MPVLMFRFPIMSGFSFVESGLFDVDLVVVAGCAFCSAFGSAAAGFVSVWGWLVFCSCSVDLVVDVCPTAATELASKDAVKTKALVAREKLFISKNLQSF